MAQPRDGLFVGSIAKGAAVDTAAAVEIFTEACRHEAEDGRGPFEAPAIPLGEVDDSNWVDAQLACMDKVTSVRRLKRSTFGTNNNYTGMPAYRVRRGQRINPDELDLRYVTRVREGYPAFQQVYRDKEIDLPRVQVGISTVDMALFALRWGAKKQLDAFIEATRRETAEVYELTEGNVFFFVETPCAIILSSMFQGRDSVVGWFATTFDKVVSALPEGAGWGFHFCYGDLDNSSIGDHGRLASGLQLRKLIYKPERTVKVVNAMLHRVEDSGHVPELVHYPFALGKRPPSLDAGDYEAYRQAYVPEGTKVFAGAIHSERTVDELNGLYPVLDDVFGKRVGMANSCGYGRHTPQHMFECMDRMSHVAYA
jgi:hypothetical protein